MSYTISSPVLLKDELIEWDDAFTKSENCLQEKC